MNFSKNNKLSKLLSLILVLCLAAALFSGCMKDDGNSNETTEPSINISLEDSQPEESQTQPTETEPVVINEKLATITHAMTVRSSPSNEAAIVAQLYAGDKVEIEQTHTVSGITWGYVSELRGWVCMDFVQMDYATNDPSGNTDTNTDATQPAATEPASNSSSTTTTNIKGVITGNGVNVRSEPSTDTGKVQGSYNKGDVVTILETQNGWGRTSKGWVKMDFVNTSASSTTGTTNNSTSSSSNSDSTVSSNGSTSVLFKGIVTAGELNIRSSGSTSADKVGSYTYGDRVEILEKSNGWGRTSKGWISLNFVYQDGTTGSDTATGTITAAGGLHIRSGPGTSYSSVGAYAEGDTVKILEQFTYSGTTWGCTSKGWISMKYVDVDGSSSNSSGSSWNGSEDDDDDDDDVLYGTVTASTLNVRSGPSDLYNVVDKVYYGDEVEIYDTEKDGGTTWGKIDGGWISMDYVDLD